LEHFRAPLAGVVEASAGPAAKKGGAGLIRMSVQEVRKLLLKLVWAFVPPPERVLA
jgi:hypothetical protein